jgi:5-methylcytosine-specific restriction protein A
MAVIIFNTFNKVFNNQEERFMPRKSKRPCSHPGCPELTAEQFCPKHKAEHIKDYNRYGRDPRHKQWYGTQWKKIRTAYISKNPLCEQCLKENRYTPADEVHHIKPLADGGTHDEANLMSLCKQHHSTITASGGWGSR